MSIHDIFCYQGHAHASIVSMTSTTHVPISENQPSLHLVVFCEIQFQNIQFQTQLGIVLVCWAVKYLVTYWLLYSLPTRSLMAEFLRNIRTAYRGDGLDGWGAGGGMGWKVTKKPQLEYIWSSFDINRHPHNVPYHISRPQRLPVSSGSNFRSHHLISTIHWCL